MRPELSLCLVTDPWQCAERGVPTTVREAVRGGVTIVQLRDKQASARALFDMAVRLRRELEGTGVPLIVNDRVDVALAAGAHGVHLGQSDLEVSEARRLAGPDFWIGLSASTASDIARANELPPGTVDYLGIGPVFATSTKLDAREPLGLEQLARLRDGTDLSCLAIGGITSENAAAVWATGVDGLAVASAICAADDPRAAAAAFVGRRS